MTATTVLAAGTFLVVLLLAVVSWHLILTLRQTRQTAAALEEFLASTRPRIEEAVDQLRSVLARADQLMSAVDVDRIGQAQLAGAMGGIVSTFTKALSAASAIAALAKVVARTLRSFQPSRTRSRI